MQENKGISHDVLRAYATAVYRAAGACAANAALLADTLVQADLWGHQSHGLLRMSWYYKRIKNGVMLPNETPIVLRDSGSVTVMDGRAGMG